MKLKQVFLTTIISIFCVMQVMAAFVPQSGKRYFIQTSSGTYVQAQASGTRNPGAKFVTGEGTAFTITAVTGGFTIQNAANDAYLLYATNNNWDTKMAADANGANWGSVWAIIDNGDGTYSISRQYNATTYYLGNGNTNNGYGVFSGQTSPVTYTLVESFEPEGENSYYLYSPVADAYFNLTSVDGKSAASYQKSGTALVISRDSDGKYTLKDKVTGKYVSVGTQAWMVGTSSTEFKWSLDGTVINGQTYYYVAKSNAYALVNDGNCKDKALLSTQGAKSKDNAHWQLIPTDDANYKQSIPSASSVFGEGWHTLQDVSGNYLISVNKGDDNINLELTLTPPSPTQGDPNFYIYYSWLLEGDDASGYTIRNLAFENGPEQDHPTPEAQMRYISYPDNPTLGSGITLTNTKSRFFFVNGQFQLADNRNLYLTCNSNDVVLGNNWDNNASKITINAANGYQVIATCGEEPVTGGGLIFQGYEIVAGTKFYKPTSATASDFTQIAVSGYVFANTNPIVIDDGNRTITVTYALASASESEHAEHIADFLKRIGGSGAANLISSQLDNALTENGKEVFIITSKNGRPHVKGSTLSAITAGIGYYLNHYAKVNLTWNNLTCDLSAANLPVPSFADKHVCTADYRYYLNYCTYSYSMSVWDEARWMKEIDWMALHGVNMPLAIVGMEAVWKKLLTDDDANKRITSSVDANALNSFVPGPSYQAWWLMGNLQGMGGPNPDWWYTHQEELGKKIVKRMRELGMEPVLPGFAGQVPTAATGLDAVSNGSWCSFTAPALVVPGTDNFNTIARKYYAALKEVLGTSKYYSMDLFHETGAAPSGITAQTMFESVAAAMPDGSKWLIQQWQWSGTQGNSCQWVGADKLVVLDLWSEVKQGWKNTYGGGKNFNGREMIYCMLHNFGGRTGIYGRLSQTINGYYEALNTSELKTKGVGATPEGIETNPILYDALYELPWTTISNVDTWVANWVESRYGADNNEAKEAWALLTSEGGILNCPTQQQGVSEPIICARPALEIPSASAWSTSKIYYDTQKVIKAADLLKSATSSLTGKKNYSYDLTDVVRQIMTDQAQPLLAEIKKAYEAKDWTKYDALVARYTTLIEDIDRLLSTNEDFMLGRWTSMARNNAGSGAAPSWSNPNYADGGYSASFSTGADWTEWNARKLITTWGYTAQCNRGRLRDYSQREWAGLLKDFYLPRWTKYFAQLKAGVNIGREDASWYAEEDEWCRKYSTQYTTTITEQTGDVATILFPKYFGKFAAASGEYYINLGFPSTNADVMDNAFRGEAYTPSIVSTPSISKIAIDLNGDGTISAEETVNATSIAIPAGANSGKALAIITMTDGTEFTFTALIKDNVTVARTVAVVKPAAEQGTVTINGGEDNEHNPVAVTDADGKLSVTTTNDVTITAVPSQAYDFVKWQKYDEETSAWKDFSTQNPYIYTEKPAFELTPVFAQNKWANVPEDKKEYGTVLSYSQYASTISFMPNADEATEIYQTATCPVNLYNVVPTVVNAAKGSAFNINWTGKGLNYTRLSAYVDLNGDGDFADDGEFVGTIGDLSKQNAELNNGSIQIVLPYDATVGLTHVRLRFDGAWETGNMTAAGGREPYTTTTRMVYDIKLNITEYSTSPTATITAISADPALGAVRITGGQIDNQNPAIVNEGKDVTLDATPATGYKFQQWVDEFERVVSTEAHYVFRPIGNMTYRAEFIAADDDYFYKGDNTINIFDVKDVCSLQSLKKEGTWTIHMDVETDGTASYNEWGSAALADGITPLAGDNGFQIYLGKGNTVKVNGFDTGISSSPNFSVDLKYNGAKFFAYLIGKDTNGTDKEVGANDTWSLTKSISADITQLSCALPVGINIKTLTIEADYSDSQYVTAPENLNEGDPYVTGNGKVQLMHAKDYITNNKGGEKLYDRVPEGKAWQMVMDVVHADNQTASYNKWGSCILASEADPINTYYWNNFQIYEHSGTDGSKRGTLNFKSNKGDGNDHVIAQGHKVFQNETNGYEDYRVIVRYDGGNVYLIRTIILDAEGNPTDQIFNNVWFAARVQHDIDVMSTALPTGTNIKTLEISIAEESNLMEDVEYAIQNERTSEYLSCHYLNGPDEHYLGADRASKFMIEFTNNRDLAFHDGDGGLHPTIYIKAEVYNENNKQIEWKYIGADNKPVETKAEAIPFLYSDNSKMIEPISNSVNGENVTSSKEAAWSIADFNRWNFVFFGNYLVKITKGNIDVNTELFGGITYKRNPFRNNEYVSLPTNAQQYQMPNTSEIGYSATITKDGTMLRVNYTPLEDTFYNITDLDLFGTGTTLYYWNATDKKLVTYSTTNSQSGLDGEWNKVVNSEQTNLFGDCSRYTIEKVTAIPVKISQSGDKYYGSIYCPNAMTLPEGVKAYRLASITSDRKYLLKPIEGSILAARTPAVLIGERDASGNWAVDVRSSLSMGDTNLFQGVSEQTANPGSGKGTDSSIYVLGSKSGIGFYPYSGAKIPAFKAYYDLPAQQAKPVSFYFAFDEDVTGITDTTGINKEGSIVYDLMGRRVTNMIKGKVYIINGEKFVK